MRVIPCFFCAARILACARVIGILGISAMSAAEPALPATGVAPAAPAPVTAWNNRRIARSSAATVTPADNGGTLALGGKTFYRLTFSAPKDYPPAFAAVVLNEDASRAKFIVLAGGESFYLWPHQAVTVFNQNNAWQTMGRAKWELPTGPFTVHTDFVHGSDKYGEADGLETGSGALKTVNHALYFVNDQFCWNPDGATPGPGGGLQSRLTVLMAPGSTDTQYVHYAMHGTRGAQGGAALTIDLNRGTLASPIKQPALLVWSAFIMIRNGTLTAPKAGGIDVFGGGRIYLQDGITFGPIAEGNAHVRLLPGGYVKFVHDYTIAAGNPKGFHIQNMHGTVASGGSITVTIADNVAFQYTYFGTDLSYGNCGAMSVRLGGHVVKTKAPVYLDGNSVLCGSAKIPGTGSIVAVHGGQAL
jgi:hypothetical protein